MRRAHVSARVAPLLLLMSLVAAPGATAQTPAAAQHWWMCQYKDPKDPSKPVLGSLMYYALFATNTPLPGELNQHFNAYIQQNYKITHRSSTGNGYCQRYSDDSTARAYSMNMILKQWASSNFQSVRVAWQGTPVEQAAGDAKSVAAAPAAPAPASAPWVSCSSSGGAGIDTYLTGVFQTTRPVRHLPSGGVLVDQSILDHFYAFLTQKGYKFKPGSNAACDVSATEAQAKAAQHKRAYEGGGCSTCGKIVETGWTE